jgi:hypothetical protein
VLERVLVDETIEMVRQGLRHFRRAAGAGTIHQTLDPVLGKAMDPFAQRRIGQVKRIGDRLEALPCHDGTDRLGTAEDPGLFRLLQYGIQGWESVIGQVEL